MFKTLLLAAALMIAGCDGDEQRQAPPPAINGIPGASASDWTIGPIIDGKNISVGMPAHPQSCPPALFCIDLPTPAQGHVHYVTFRHGPLTGKAGIILRYRVEADEGVRIEPRAAPGGPSLITVYFQRRGDDWSAKGKYETYRWYASFSTQMPIEAPGVHRIDAPFDARWTAVLTSDNQTASQAWREALANADQVGFVLGGGDGLGHGVWATGRARLVVEEFRVY